MLRQWVSTAVTDIVGYFSINPEIMYGTLNIGPDPKMFPEIYPDPIKPHPESGRFYDSHRDEFETAYLVFATNVCSALSSRLEPTINDSIDRGFSDVVCEVIRYRIGTVIVRVRGEFKI